MRYRRFLKALWYHRDWGERRVLLTDSPSQLLAEAISLRARFSILARNIAVSAVPKSKTARRWHIQKCRFAFNRLLYLLPFDELQWLVDTVPPIDELWELHLVSSSLLERDATRLINAPGRLLSAFAQLVAASGAIQGVRVELPAAPLEVHRDGASILAAHGICSFPQSWIAALPSETDRALLRFAQGIAATQREFDDFSYADELRTLQIGVTREDMTRLLLSRWGEAEADELSALQLGGGYAS